MITRLVDRGWSGEINTAVHLGSSELRIISPFIKDRALARLLVAKPNVVSAITRFNLSDFADGVSDIAALRRLLEYGATVRGIKNLHAKMYLFGSQRAIITSANLSEAALNRNHEFGVISEDPDVIVACRQYFDGLWLHGGTDLTLPQLNIWNDIVTRHQLEGGRSTRKIGLGDFGADAGAVSPPLPDVPVIVADAPQGFVKFLGQGSNRVPLSYGTIEEIKDSGCHWAVAYPTTKRPRSLKDDALIFIARFTCDPNDIRVFGRAIGLRHVPGRDDATDEEIAHRDWKATWSRYVRVHNAEFVAGSMENGISLSEMMNELEENSFAPTQRNAAKNDESNKNPRRAFLRQAAVELSTEGIVWLSDRLQTAFDHHGKIPQDTMRQLDWPVLPNPNQ